jgi:negative regulator of sigma-B (phosphoserine phosphatase)
MTGWPQLSCAIAEAALSSEPESGDRHLIQPFEDGVLVAAVDGIGHGLEAAEAAKRAIATLASAAQDSPISLVQRCHEQLKETRGAVMTLAAINLRQGTLTWIGVGNVEAVLFHESGDPSRRSDRALLRGGVVGYQLPELRAEVLPLAPHDTLVLTTDGVKPEFAETIAINGDPQALADSILARFRKTTDDALVVVVQYTGGAA